MPNQTYYRRGMRAKRRLQLLHTLVPSLHEFPDLPERPGGTYVRCQSCGLTAAAQVKPECVFCDPDKIASPIDWRTSPAGHSVMVFEPLDPVTPGHQLVVPSLHVEDAREDPALTAEVNGVAAEVAQPWPAANIITSIGAPASQSVFHLHVHIVPRFEGDGLLLPWSPRA